MSTPYKQKYLVVMESGQTVQCEVYGEDLQHGEGVAIAYAIEKLGGQVWDTANMPVVENSNLKTYTFDMKPLAKEFFECFEDGQVIDCNTDCFLDIINKPHNIEGHFYEEVEKQAKELGIEVDL